MSKEMIVYKTVDGDELKLSTDILRSEVLSPDVAAKATEQELQFYLARCRFLGLNPYLGEIYFVKYGNNPATYIISFEVLLKRLNTFPEYNGKDDGVTVLRKSDGAITRRPGTIVLDGEELIGGWCKISRKDRAVPEFAEVSMKEYNQKVAQWNVRPATMIRKVAISHAIRETFPKEYEGVYIDEEIDRRDNAVMGAAGPATTAQRITDAQTMALVRASAGHEEEADRIIRAAGFSNPTKITVDRYDGIMEELTALSRDTVAPVPVAEVAPEAPEESDRRAHPYADHAPYKGKHKFAGVPLKDIPEEFLKDEATKQLDPDNKFYEVNKKLQQLIRRHLAGPESPVVEAPPTEDAGLPFDVDFMR